MKLVKKWKFLSAVKQANITPVSSKGEREYKNNYRPVSILSNVSKILKDYFQANIKLYGFLLFQVSMWI